MADGFDDIQDDHQTVLDLLERYAREADDAVARDACLAIAMHTAAEEIALYPHLRALGPGEDSPGEDGVQLADRAALDHAAISTQVARVLAAPPIDLREPMAHITDQVRAHIHFEDGELLPPLRAIVDADALHDALVAAKDAVRSRAGQPMF